MRDESYQRSTAKSIEFMGERAKRLFGDVMSRFRDVDWYEICKMRDFMTHQYDEVDLPFLKQYCQRIVAILESESDEEGE